MARVGSNTSSIPAPPETTASSFSDSAVSAIVEERIERGVYALGSRVPAERILAEELGVSRRFVRLAYSRLIERGLLEKSHYRRPFVAFSGGAARQLTQTGAPTRPTDSENGPPTSQTIAAIIPSHPKFAGGLSIIAGIHKVLADMESPYRLTFLDTFHQDRAEVLRREARAIESAVEAGVAGLIWWYYSDEEAVEKIVRQHPDTTFVFVDRYPRNIHCDFTGIDDEESSRTAVEYLIDLNHSRIAHLMDPGNYSTILERAQGYRTAHATRGMPVSDDLIWHLDWDTRRMEKAFEHFYSLPDPPTALFTSNDFIAYEFIEVAEAHGIKVPDQLSVLGHGNIDRYTPREFLTTVDQPFEMIGRSAAKLLLKRLENRSKLSGTYQQVILPAPLILRDSCRELV
ncbi:MAG: GntR family transcriptional regulator [Fibrella sp.]|nr:GntR family transcriptional regulator [Armatimonadota bacterium]